MIASHPWADVRPAHCSGSELGGQHEDPTPWPTPLRAIAAELYRLGTGYLEPITVKTRVREIYAIARAVSSMTERMKLSFPRHAADVVQADVTALRAIAHSMPPLAEDQAKRIMNVAADLQLELATLLHGEAIVAQRATRWTAQRGVGTRVRHVISMLQSLPL